MSGKPRKLYLLEVSDRCPLNGRWLVWTPVLSTIAETKKQARKNARRYDWIGPERRTRIGTWEHAASSLVDGGSS